jgi:hypothetical protein
MRSGGAAKRDISDADFFSWLIGICRPNAVKALGEGTI